MKKYITLLAAGSFCALLLAQSTMTVHLGSSLLNVFDVADVDSVTFNNDNMFVKGKNPKTYKVADVDSVTFYYEPKVADTVFVRYEGDKVDVLNPYTDISVETSGSNVAIVSAHGTKGIVYCLSGSSSNGSFTLTPDRGYTLCLDNLNLANPTSAPVVLNAAASGENYVANIHLRGASSLEDGSASSFKGALYTKSKMKISDDTLYSNTSLTVVGNAKHAINSSKRIELYSGELNIAGAVSDGINADGVEVYGGSLTIGNTGGDGVDCSEKVLVAGGKVSVGVSASDVKGIKCDSIVEIAGGELLFNVTGAGAKAIKSGVKTLVSGGSLTAELLATTAFVNVADATDVSYNAALTSNGNVEILGNALVKVTGNGVAARAVSADGNVLVSGGELIADLTGAYNIESANNDTTSVFGIKADTAISVTGGKVNITIGEEANIAKGMKADKVYVQGGEVSITNEGGYWYTASTNSNSSNSNRPWGGGFGGGFGGGSTTTVTSSTPKAIRGESVVAISGGKVSVTCLHGKAITSNELIEIGETDADNSKLELNIVSGVSTDPYYNASSEKTHNLRYCGPKSILCDKVVKVNSGTINITSFDSGIKGKDVTVNGGLLTISAAYDQGIHGIQTLTINGGDILVSESFEAFEGTTMTFNGGVTSVYASDDAWNCSTSTSGTGTASVTVNGGVHYLYVGSGDTDALDSNGSMSFQGGVVIVESGNVSLDCDATPSFNSKATLMLFCKSAETLPSGATSLSVTSPAANTRYTAAANGSVLSTFTTTQSASQLIYISGSSPTFTSGGTYAPGNEVVIRGKNNTTMVYGYGGTISGGSTLTSKTASAQGMGGGGRW